LPGVLDVVPPARGSSEFPTGWSAGNRLWCVWTLLRNRSETWASVVLCA